MQIELQDTAKTIGSVRDGIKRIEEIKVKSCRIDSFLFVRKQEAQGDLEDRNMKKVELLFGR